MIFLNSAAGFHTVVAKVPGGVTEGLYAASGWADLLSRMDKPEVQGSSNVTQKRQARSCLVPAHCWDMLAP